MTNATQKYLDSYKVVCPSLTKEELNFIAERTSTSKLKSKTYYLKKDQVQREMSFVYQGLLRSFYIDDKGSEITIQFIREGEYVADYMAFITQKPTKFYIQCIEPCILVNISFLTIQDAYSNFKNFENYGRKIAEAILVNKQNRIESFLFENAESRYLNFIKQNPSLVNRVSVTHLCSFLGIERQSLTRIRKKLQTK
ncbi:MAG: Crp/Fnr family transcriptional regulator [Bacteroidetes bacterium]|nr:Crp/Fnr family transcriptional regulator [Bacteroidota bacterium]